MNISCDKSLEILKMSLAMVIKAYTVSNLVALFVCLYVRTYVVVSCGKFNYS